MDALFGKPKTVKEVVRDNKRALDHSGRDLDRELLNLDREEKQIGKNVNPRFGMPCEMKKKLQKPKKSR